MEENCFILMMESSLLDCLVYGMIEESGDKFQNNIAYLTFGMPKINVVSPNNDADMIAMNLQI
jgi:hypothetical protein